MNIRLFLYGLGIWVWATIGLRLGGQYLLQAGDWKRTLVVFAVSFPLMAWIARRLCSRFQVPREEWGTGAIALVLPTLCLDPFSSVFFPIVFPNMAPEAAGAFGGWMLWCCAGALVGVTVHR